METTVAAKRADPTNTLCLHSLNHLTEHPSRGTYLGPWPCPGPPEGEENESPVVAALLILNKLILPNPEMCTSAICQSANSLLINAGMLFCWEFLRVEQ